MDTMDTVDWVLGLSLKSEQLGYAHMAARAVLMYVLLLVLIRAGKKRFLGRATAFDVILVIMVGSVAARGMTGGAPFFPALLGVAVLIMVHWVFSWAARDVPWLSGLIKGHSTLLIQHGHIQHDALAKAHMSDDDLQEDLREQGARDPTEVVEARLERSGRLSVIKSPPKN
jgi:uncharacterized membrane protein YcaP (DUF421 family)